MAIASIANLTDSTVAGSNTEIQYNNSGVFGASSNLTFDGSTLTVNAAAVFNESSADVDFRVESNDDANMLFVDAGNNRVGIATNTPAYAFDVTKSVDSAYVAHVAQAGTAFSSHVFRLDYSAATIDNNVGAFLGCFDTTSSRCLIMSDGDLLNHDNSYGGISDERLKQDIVDASSQWDDIKNLRVRKYKFISDVEAHGDNAVAHIGVIAQEAELVSPGLVQHRVADAVLDDEGNEVEPAIDEYSVQYSVLYMKCVKALQEAMSRIETLEAQVAALQGA